MSKRPEIAPCPMPGCGDELRLRVDCYNEWFISCDACGYQAGWHTTKEEAAKAHNYLARRLDPVSLLRRIGGMKGRARIMANVCRGIGLLNAASNWESEAYGHDSALRLIRAMRDETTS
jgi:hypothetical protein